MSRSSLSRAGLSRAGVLLAAAGSIVLAGGASAWADPTPAAAPVVDISVERTLNTPTDLVTVSPTRPANIDISLVNRGTAAQDAEFGLTVPSGWTVAPAYDLPADETCGLTAGAYTCDVTALPAGQARSTQLLVTAATGTVVGSVTTAPVTGGPVGAVDSNPSNNATQFRFQDVGSSDVSATITQTATTVAPGGTIGFTVTLTNRGPDRTVGQFAAIRVDTQTEGAVTPLPPTGPGQIETGGGEGPLPVEPIYGWSLELDPGQSASLQVTWRGEVLGATATLVVRSSHEPSSANVPGIFDETRSQPVTVTAASAPAPAPSPTAPGPTTPVARRGPVLAATGTQHVAGLGGLGVGLVVLGGLTVATTRRRPRLR